MTRRSAKNKGKQFERDVAKALGEWWQGSSFRRVPLSGGWDKLSTDGKVVATGDIFTPQDFPYSVECKRQEGFDFNSIFCNDSLALVTSWWNQCVTDAASASRQPMLVIQKNRCQPIVIIRNSELLDITSFKVYCVLQLGEPVVVVRLSEFLGTVKRDNSGGSICQ